MPGVSGRWVVTGLAVLALTACRGKPHDEQSATTTRATSASTTTAASLGPGNVERLGLPTTVRNGEVVHLLGKCPFGDDYMVLSLAFDPVTGGPTAGYVAAHTGKGDGHVDAQVAASVPPGEYVVRPACIMERTPPFSVFPTFDITVTR
jgi:hypothetical protein